MAQFRYASMSRRAAMTAAALATMAALSGCGGKTGASADGDMALGAAEGAKVTVVEYASVTCPHCALWQENTWPAFKAKYVDTNKVRYVFRELPTPPQDVAVAGFLIARCAAAKSGGDEKYFQIVHEIMSSQPEWRQGIAPRDTLIRIANGAGVDFQACVSDEAAVAAMEKRIEGARTAGVTGTPYFFVNGTPVITPGGEGASMADLSTAIEAELAK